LEKITDPRELFKALEGLGILNRENLLMLQKGLFDLGRKDLIAKGVDYARREGNLLRFFPASAVPGMSLFKFM